MLPLQSCRPNFTRKLKYRNPENAHLIKHYQSGLLKLGSQFYPSLKSEFH